MTHLDHTKALYEELYPRNTQKFGGICGLSDDNIAKLQQRLGKEFPASFREFLDWAGLDSDELFAPYDSPYSNFFFLIDHLCRLNGVPVENRLQAQQELLTSVQAAQLPTSELLVFLNRHDPHPVRGFNEFYSMAMDSDDPPVYCHRAGKPQVHVATHFSAFLESLLMEQKAVRDHLTARYGLHKPFRQTHYLDEVKQIFETVRTALYDHLFWEAPEPSTVQEIEAIERLHGFAFPDALREYSLWIGGNAEFAPGGGEMQLERFVHNYRWLRTSFIHEHLEQPFPEDAVVFYTEVGTHACYARAGEGDEAKCYWYTEGEAPQEVGTLADWLAGELSWYLGDDGQKKQGDDN
jgi:SMI1 / KNR4 family (SUKH-1)